MRLPTRQPELIPTSCSLSNLHPCSPRLATLRHRHSMRTLKTSQKIRLKRSSISMDRDWKGSLQAECQLQSLQKQLLDLQTQLGTMNRDLGPDERLYFDRLDQDDWPEARRALRDATTRLARYIKEMDSGETVYAGKKRWFDKNSGLTWYRESRSMVLIQPTMSLRTTDPPCRISSPECRLPNTTDARKAKSEISRR